MPKEKVVVPPFLEGSRLGWGWEQPGLLKGVPAHGRGVKQDGFEDPFQL